MEIGLPSETGRAQILKIHTARMRDNKKIADDVDLQVRFIKKASISKQIVRLLIDRNWQC
jgi:ATP-dependent 26S proteasome regulatory subunit